MFRWLFQKRSSTATGIEPELVPNPNNQSGGSHEFVRVSEVEVLSLNGNPVQIEANEYKVSKNNAPNK